MVLLPNPHNSPHEPEVGSPYCSDPDCQFCKDLRAAHAQLQEGQPVTPSSKGSAA
jgi:hypothetical protein